MSDRAAKGKSGLLVVISGPSGAGKTTIARAVEKELGASFSVSATTRPKAATDVEGRDYYFLDETTFQNRVNAGEMLESAFVFGKYWYGTPRRPVEEALERGEIVILEIDVQGGLQVRESMPEAMLIFIEPPTEEELLRRLRSRGRDDEPTIQRRFAEAKREIEIAKSSDAYDVFVINEDLTSAVEQVCGLIRAARDKSATTS